jgi:hypothetical protein
VLRITNLNLKITKRIACSPLEGVVSLHNQAHNPTLGFGVWVRVDRSWCPLPYIGKPGSAKAAGTTDGSTSTVKPPSPPATASASTSAPAKTNKTQADLLAELMKCIKDQDTQIKALKASF